MCGMYVYQCVCMSVCACARALVGVRVYACGRRQVVHAYDTYNGRLDKRVCILQRDVFYIISVGSSSGKLGIEVVTMYAKKLRKISGCSKSFLLTCTETRTHAATGAAQ